MSNKIKKYFNTEDKAVESILKRHLNREILKSDYLMTETLNAIKTSVKQVFYKGILIGEFANKIEVL